MSSDYNHSEGLNVLKKTEGKNAWVNWLGSKVQIIKRKTFLDTGKIEM